jgi:predicted phosphoribosyltransferase
MLGRMLRPEYGGAEDVIVLSIPSGGVPVGLQASVKLDCPMDLMIVRKLQIPGNPEAGFGAVTSEGTLFLNERLLGEIQLTPSQIEVQAKKVRAELERQKKLFRRSEDPAAVAGRSVILVDDGLASGYTMMASVHDVRQRGAAKIVVAIPTAPESSIERMLEGTDDIFCPNVREGPFFAVAEAYEHWYDLSHEEVMQLLNESARVNPEKGTTWHMA